MKISDKENVPTEGRLRLFLFLLFSFPTKGWEKKKKEQPQGKTALHFLS